MSKKDSDAHDPFEIPDDLEITETNIDEIVVGESIPNDEAEGLEEAEISSVEEPEEEEEEEEDLEEELELGPPLDDESSISFMPADESANLPPAPKEDTATDITHEPKKKKPVKKRESALFKRKNKQKIKAQKVKEQKTKEQSREFVAGAGAPTKKKTKPIPQTVDHIKSIPGVPQKPKSNILPLFLSLIAIFASLYALMIALPVASKDQGILFTNNHENNIITNNNEIVSLQQKVLALEKKLLRRTKTKKTLKKSSKRGSSGKKVKKRRVYRRKKYPSTTLKSKRKVPKKRYYKRTR